MQPESPVRAHAWWTVSNRDQWRPLTVIVLVIAVGAVVFAITGIPQLPLMTPLHRYGWVTPTCGLTRGTVALARGDITRALAFNPASVLVAVVAAAGMARALIGVFSGRWVHVHLAARARIPFAVTLAVCTLGLWAWQQSNAHFIINDLQP